jgi:hypothetical protein
LYYNNIALKKQPFCFFLIKLVDDFSVVDGLFYNLQNFFEKCIDFSIVSVYTYIKLKERRTTK